MLIIIAILLLVLCMTTETGRTILLVLLGAAWYGACFVAVIVGLVLLSVVVA